MGSYATVAMAGLNMIAQQQQARAAKRAAQEQANRDLQRIHLAQQIEERNKRESLKRAEAAHRAHFGGRGIGASGGSAAAVQRGLQQQTARDLEDAAHLRQFQINDINSRSRSNQKANLLNASNAARHTLFRTVLNRLPTKSLFS